MITLILVVCLTAKPDICEEQRPPVEIVSQMSCLVQGQQIAAEWLEEHPKWRLLGWRCQFGARAKEA